MEQGFYKDRLARRGLRVLIPEQPERDFINTVLFEETGVGIVKESSKQAFYRIAEQLAQNGAECIILGCTEIEMLMKQEETNMPLFDTTALYAGEDRAVVLQRSVRRISNVQNRKTYCGAWIELPEAPSPWQIM